VFLFQQQLGHQQPGCCHFRGCAQCFEQRVGGISDLPGLQLAAGENEASSSEIGFRLQSE
jgi:hypothetical protein